MCGLDADAYRLIPADEDAKSTDADTKMSACGVRVRTFSAQCSVSL